MSPEEVRDFEENTITSIEHLMKEGCTPINKCNECPSKDKHIQGHHVLCAALTSIRNSSLSR